MAKNHQTENPLFKALIKQSEADIATAFDSLVVYFDNPSSDGAIIKSMQCQLDKIATAEKRIETLKQTFQQYSNIINEVLHKCTSLQRSVVSSWCR